MTIELESKFLVPNSSAESVFAELASLEEIEHFCLSETQNVTHIDTYFDSEGQKLLDAEASLRTRQVDNKNLFVTLKLSAANGTQSQNSVARHEIEGVPEPKIVAEIHTLLAQHGLTDREHDNLLFYQSGIDGVLHSWGYAPLFKLTKRRSFREISIDSQYVAELVLDQVEIHGGGRTSLLYEIEIESTSDKEEHIKEFGKTIQRKYRGLRASKKSKYKRGAEFIGTEDHHKVETKLIVDDLEKVRVYLDSRSLGDFVVGIPIQSRISDTYFDTSDLSLLKHNCYLRLRRDGTELLLTLRRYDKTDENQLIDTRQIKRRADESTLLEILSYVTEEDIHSLPRDFRVDSNIHGSLIRAGLIESLHVDIQRTTYQVTDIARKIAAIKLDSVSFSFGSSKVQHSEIEVSTDDPEKTSDLRAIAYSLVSRLGVQPTGSPKYVIGISQTRDELPDLVRNSDVIQIYTRRDSIEPKYSKQDISLLQNELKIERAKITDKITNDAKVLVRNRILL